MKIQRVFILSFLFTSCMTIRTRDFITDMKLSEGFYVGYNKDKYFYGVWGEIKPDEDYSPISDEFVLIFKNPDSILVKEQYIYLQRKNKYCLILDEDKDSIVHFGDIIKTRDKKKVESLIQGFK